MLIEDEILVGALDLHAHGHPEFTLARRPRLSNVEWATEARRRGMRGFVIKSHAWPTVQVALMLRELHPDLDVFGSITLNPPSGGLSPTAVEMAGQLGAKVVWMPTWSALHDPVRHSISLDRMKPYLRTLDVDRAQHEDALTVLGRDGGVKPEVLDILQICAELDMTVASGHLPIASSVLLAQAAAREGVRFVLTHACSGSVAAPVELQREVAATGGYIEHVMVGSMPMHQRTDPRVLVDAIEAVGPEHCVMATDAGEAWNPPAPELMRMFIATLLALGVAEDDVRRMTHENPARALGLPVEWAPRDDERTSG